MTRVIRKYPNRRLYDTHDSRYVTLSDIYNLVRAEQDVVVIDRKSGNDITRAILLQVISDREFSGETLLSREFLIDIIRQPQKVVPVVNEEAEKPLTSGP